MQKQLDHSLVCFCVCVQEPDEADALLKAERSHLLTLKKTLESQLRKVHTQLQVCTHTCTRTHNTRMHA